MLQKQSKISYKPFHFFCFKTGSFDVYYFLHFTALVFSYQDAFSPTYGGNSIIDKLQKRNYYIIPQNKLGQDIFIRATEARGLQNIIRMPSGDMKAVKVPVSKNMLESHLKGKLCRKIRTMVTIIIAEAQVQFLLLLVYYLHGFGRPNFHVTFNACHAKYSVAHIYFFIFNTVSSS